MKRNPVIPLVLVVLAAIGGVLGTVFTSSSPLLGLDLQGGASVVLRPTKNVKPDVLDRTIGIIRSRVDSSGVAEADITRQGDSIVVQLPGVKDPDRILRILQTTAELRFRPVLGDIPSEDELKAALATPTTKLGSVTKTVTITTAPKAGTATTKVGSPTTGAPATTSAASVTTVVTATTVVAATSIVATTAPAAVVAPAAGFNHFAIGNQAADSAAATPTTAAPAPTTAAASASTAAAPASTAASPTTAAASPTTAAGTATAAPTTAAGTATTAVKSATTALASVTTIKGSAPTTVPAAAPAFDLSQYNTTSREKDTPEAVVILPKDKALPSAPRLQLGPVALTGAIVKDATPSISQSGSWQVDIELNGRGTTGFNKLAQDNCRKRVAIVLDGVVVSDPVINADQSGTCSFPSGRVQITGNFSESDARGLSTALRFGSLPVELIPQQKQVVSPTLGRDSLRAGILSGIIGLALVALYMLVYYRLLGLVVVSGLLVSVGLLWSIVTFLSAKQGLALSLSGAVGIIVSVGVTVDSYVVFFERIRDEIRSGKPMVSSVERGFKSAWRTILAADLTSFIGALVLYLLTVGSVRGFAFFLMLSTALDLVVTYFFTRNLVAILARRKSFTGRSLGIYNQAPAAVAAGGVTTGVLRPTGTKPASQISASTSGGQS
jgi:preprotein translocase subunit SecD